MTYQYKLQIRNWTVFRYQNFHYGPSDKIGHGAKYKHDSITSLYVTQSIIVVK